MNQKEAMKQITEHLKQIKSNLRAAQKLADKYGLEFKVAIDLPPGARNQDDYSVEKVAGTYIAKGTEEVDIDEEGKSIYNEHGKFYWENSSLNC